ncbi:MAG: CHAT domain-containing protein [Actinomycetota bacterium]
MNAVGDPGDADRLLNLGNEHFWKSQFREAIAVWEQALSIYQQNGNRQGEANSLGNLGNAYLSLGQYQQAIGFHHKSVIIAREIGHRQAEANALGSLGNTYRSLGQYQQAIAYHQQSLAIAREIGHRQAEANALGNLGNAYHSLGQYQQAIAFHQQHLAMAREIESRQGEAISLGNLGIAYDSLGQYQQAIAFHQQHLAMARKIGDRQGEANSLGNLGLAYDFLGQYQQAIAYHQHSLAIKREIGDRQGEANSLNNLGNTLFQIQQFTEAEKALRQAIQIRETLRTNLEDTHQISIFETQRSTYRLLQKALVAQHKLTEALEISERGRTRAFVALLKQRLGESTQTETTSSFLTVANIQQIARQQNATLIEYSLVTEEIYIWIVHPSGEIIFRRANLEPLTQFNQSLTDLETIILQARVSLDLTEKDSGGNAIQLTEIGKPQEGNYPFLQLLYQILIEPLADLLPTEPEAPIIFIPHYALFLVPFAALQHPASKRYLLEDHTLLIAPSIEVLQLTHQQHQRLRNLRQDALVVGEPTLHEKFKNNPYKLQQYPSVKVAAESIAKILATNAITGSDATKVAVVNALQQVRIAHIFAHGLLDEYQSDERLNNRIPGTIVLAPANEQEDGALNAAEILTLNLNCEIVVLSACSTGQGTIAGDGIIGLSRCFILAGVPSLIVSLWKIGAPAAKVAMTEFYQNLSQGQNRAAALRYAMLATKERFPQPKSWAAFTLIGETDILPLNTQNIEEALRKMAIPESATPEQIFVAFNSLLDYSESAFLSNQISGLSLNATDSVADMAAKIKAWSKNRPNLEENIENQLCEMGLADADKSKPEISDERKQELCQKLENINRLSKPTEPKK